MLAVIAIAFHFAISIFNVGALHGQTGDPLLRAASRTKGPLWESYCFLCACIAFAVSALMLLLVLLLSVGGEVAVGLWWLGGGGATTITTVIASAYWYCYCLLLLQSTAVIAIAYC